MIFSENRHPPSDQVQGHAFRDHAPKVGDIMRVLVTGGAGLVGTECCKLFASEGWDVVSIDNYMRARIFGADAETKDNILTTRKSFRIEHHELDIRDEKVGELIKNVDVVIH